MKRNIIFIIMISILLTLFGCKDKVDPYQVVNSGFEDGMTGWTANIEVFINGGKQAITSTIYGSNATDSIYLYSEQDALFEMNHWDLVVE